MKFIIIIAFLIILIALMIQGQHKMIYFPRAYGADQPVPEFCRVIEYTTSQGRQVSYYIPPSRDKNKPPERLWMMFGGNASLALDWLELIRDFPDRDAGFLLLEYPGYGRCEGKAGPDTILESSSAALDALVVDIKIDEDTLKDRLNILGHSLGAATGLLFGSRFKSSRVVLISPFTSLRDMATLVVGKPLNRTLFHNYDNRTRIKEILSQPVPPVVTIIHGDHDKVIPVRMGRELAAIDESLRYFEAKNGDHNYILVTAKKEIVNAMTLSLIDIKSTGLKNIGDKENGGS